MNITEEKDGTLIVDIPRVYEDELGIIVDIIDAPDNWEAQYEFNEETGQWETVFEIELIPEEN